MLGGGGLRVWTGWEGRVTERRMAMDECWVDTLYRSTPWIFIARKSQIRVNDKFRERSFFFLYNSFLNE